MRSRLLTEFYWLAGVATITVLASWLLGFDTFSNTPFDIQLHDTYFVIEPWLIAIVIFVVLLTTIYLGRAVYFKLKNKLVNIILTLLLLMILVFQVKNLQWVNGLESHEKAVYSRDIDSEIRSQVIASYQSLKSVLWVLVVINGALVATTGYKTVVAKGLD